MTRTEEKTARAALDIAVMVWNGSLGFDSGVWFIRRNCDCDKERAGDLLQRFMAALATKELEKMLKRIGEKNA